MFKNINFIESSLTTKEKVKKEILEQLESLKNTTDISILMAVESGSRAWGCASNDSDYDVRIIFKSPLHRYLEISPPPDNIDYFHGKLLDINGWDIRKALKLVYKSNATPFEWVQSPIVYFEQPSFRQELMQLCELYFQPYHALNHYRGIAKNSYETAEVGQPFKLKKLFYVIRPLLAATWIIKYKSIPSMDLPNLMPQIQDQTILKKIQELLDIKKDVDESYLYTLEADIHEFISELFATVDSAEIPRPDITFTATRQLNAAFRKYIGYYDKK